LEDIVEDGTRCASLWELFLGVTKSEP
jgi:hypothetical protein